MNSVRESFVEHFGEEEAARVEAASRSHRDAHCAHKEGSDPFKYHICICIGFQCMDVHRGGHGFVASWEELKAWIKEHGELASHDGDVDYLALFCGAYNEFMPKKETNEL